MQAKTKELKASLNQDFRLIHELCLFVLNASQRPDLIRATLNALHAFLSWCEALPLCMTLAVVLSILLI